MRNSLTAKVPETLFAQTKERFPLRPVPMSTATRSSEDPRELLLMRLAESAYRRGQFTLASGRSSEHYVNCKPVSLSGAGLALISASPDPLRLTGLQFT